MVPQSFFEACFADHRYSRPAVPIYLMVPSPHHMVSSRQSYRDVSRAPYARRLCWYSSCSQLQPCTGTACSCYGAAAQFFCRRYPNVTYLPLALLAGHVAAGPDAFTAVVASASNSIKRLPVGCPVCFVSRPRVRLAGPGATAVPLAFIRPGDQPVLGLLLRGAVPAGRCT